MAVKVIKEGKLIEEQPRQCNCWKCQSVLEYKNEDIMSNLKNENYIECPICHSYISNNIKYFSTYARTKAN